MFKTDQTERARPEHTEHYYDTLDALVKEHITDAANGDPKPVEFTKTDGETVKIAVTGTLCFCGADVLLTEGIIPVIKNKLYMQDPLHITHIHS